jgi:potassium efflux system protein
MKQPIVLALFAVCFFLLALSRPLVAAEEGIGTALPLMPVTLEMLKSRIAEVKAVADPQDETKTKLVQLYRKALSHLEEANANVKGAAAFEKATQTAPAQTALIREQIGAAKGTDPLETLDVGLTTRLEQIEQRLKKKQADLAAVNARHADFERRLTYQQNRPVAISQRLAKAKQQQEEVMAALKVVPTVDESPVLAQARRWVLTTRYAALSIEIKRLDQELLS